ncbi:MAG TPA: isoprenylcysteine carboxylmethyltransferase family protein [Dehalococcoidia bacterium]|nr:isoprenylcysteine carboxylmethyltransferase family protein [Dehalococcoidia bacterium]
MSLIPAFEIGIWNVWIPMLYFPLHPFIMIVVDKLVGVGNITKKMGDVPYTRAEKKMSNAMVILILLACIYAIFLPLKLGTLWFYIGMPVYLIGLIMLTWAIVNIATTPEGKPFTRGLYRYSRHPMTFWGNIMHLGVSIASASWVFLLFSIVVAILLLYLVIAEERGCIEHYGAPYRKYMNKTPRWLGIPKAV